MTKRRWVMGGEGQKGGKSGAAGLSVVGQQRRVSETPREAPPVPVRPRVRDDLEVTPKGKERVSVRVAGSERAFDLYAFEWKAARFMDGTRTVEEIATELSLERGATSPRLVTSFVRELRGYGFLSEVREKSEDLLLIDGEGPLPDPASSPLNDEERTLLVAADSFASRGDMENAANYLLALLEISPQCHEARARLRTVQSQLFSTAREKSSAKADRSPPEPVLHESPPPEVAFDAADLTDPSAPLVLDEPPPPLRQPSRPRPPLEAVEEPEVPSRAIDAHKRSRVLGAGIVAAMLIVLAGSAVVYVKGQAPDALLVNPPRPPVPLAGPSAQAVEQAVPPTRAASKSEPLLRFRVPLAPRAQAVYEAMASGELEDVVSVGSRVIEGQTLAHIADTRARARLKKAKEEAAKLKARARKSSAYKDFAEVAAMRVSKLERDSAPQELKATAAGAVQQVLVPVGSRVEPGVPLVVVVDATFLAAEVPTGRALPPGARCRLESSSASLASIGCSLGTGASENSVRLTIDNREHLLTPNQLVDVAIDAPLALERSTAP